MNDFTSARIAATARQGLAGAVGGWLGYLLLEPGIRRQEESGAAGSDLSMMLAGFLLGGLITFCLAAADEIATRRWLRMLTRGVASGLGGAVLGFVFLSLAGWLYGQMAPLSQVGGSGFQVFRRTVGWALWGLGVGLGAGLASRSQRRVFQGCVGGLIGGLCGGLMFDILPAFNQGTGLSRLVGFVGLGLCVGAATALVEQLVSVAWVRFLTGSREGQVIYLHRDATVMGRDELADVPLFGDPNVAQAQVILQLTPAPSIHELGAGQLLRVDGIPCRSGQLVDGTLIEIGTHRLRFHQRAYTGQPRDFSSEAGFLRETARKVPSLPSSPAPDVTWMGTEMPAPNELISVPHPAPPSTSHGDDVSLGLRIVAGPCVGKALALRPGLTLGRERDNHLMLEDGKVSRYHARIDRLEGAWVITDLESRNGTRLNGVRILRCGLEAGDYLYLGDCVLRIEVERSGSDE